MSGGFRFMAFGINDFNVRERALGVLLFLVVFLIVKLWLPIALIFGVYIIVRSIDDAQLGFDAHEFHRNEMLFSLFYVVLFATAHGFHYLLYREPFVIINLIVSFIMPFVLWFAAHRLIRVYFSRKGRRMRRR